MNVYLTTPDQIENFKAKKQFSHFKVFSAEKTKNYQRSDRLSAGEYVLALSDTTLGILSESSSDVKVTIKLAP